MRLSDDPENMSFLLQQNKKNISSELYDSLFYRINELRILKKHAMTDLSSIDTLKLDFEETSASVLAKNIISQYNNKVDKLVNNYKITPEYITPLKLQKLMYYVQGLCLQVFKKRAFPEKIKAWNYGPVVEEVYQEYKENHEKEIMLDENIKCVSNGISKIIEKAIDSYGKLEANDLIDFTHEEEPWIKTKRNSEITIDKMKEYFSKVYDN